MDAPCSFHHDHLIRQSRNVGTACRTSAKHHGNLRNASSRHLTLPPESTTKMILVRKDPVLFWKKGTTTINEINTRQFMLLGYFLRTRMFPHGFRKKGAALGGRIIGNDHTGAIVDHANPGDDTSPRHFVAIKPVGSQRRQLKKSGVRIQNHLDPFTHKQFASLFVALTKPVTTPLRRISMLAP